MAQSTARAAFERVFLPLDSEAASADIECLLLPFLPVEAAELCRARADVEQEYAERYPREDGEENGYTVAAVVLRDGAERIASLNRGDVHAAQSLSVAFDHERRRRSSVSSVYHAYAFLAGVVGFMLVPKPIRAWVEASTSLADTCGGRIKREALRRIAVAARTADVGHIASCCRAVSHTAQS